ncbi:hypothetical protein HDU67_006119 [Dinochytrium kinnereticum]|nr:hypothetical protein HDU67_006119 [Dinochytrium kinnereticum]
MDSLTQQMDALRTSIVNSGRGAGGNASAANTPRSMGQRSLRPVHTSPANPALRAVPSREFVGQGTRQQRGKLKPFPYDRFMPHPSLVILAEVNSNKSLESTPMKSVLSQSKSSPGNHYHPLLAVLLPATELSAPATESPGRRHSPVDESKKFTPSIATPKPASYFDMAVQKGFPGKDLRDVTTSEWSEIGAEDSVSCRGHWKSMDSDDHAGKPPAKDFVAPSIEDESILKVLECVNMALGSQDTEESVPFPHGIMESPAFGRAMKTESKMASTNSSFVPILDSSDHESFKSTPFREPQKISSDPRLVDSTPSRRLVLRDQSNSGFMAPRTSKPCSSPPSSHDLSAKPYINLSSGAATPRRDYLSESRGVPATPSKSIHNNERLAKENHIPKGQVAYPPLGYENKPVASIPRIEYQSMVMDNDDTFLERVIAPVMAKYAPVTETPTRMQLGINDPKVGNWLSSSQDRASKQVLSSSSSSHGLQAFDQQAD